MEQGPKSTGPPPKPCYEASGLLVAEQKQAPNGVVLLYSQPPEAAVPLPSDPSFRLRLYIFKSLTPSSTPLSAPGMGSHQKQPQQQQVEEPILLGRRRQSAYLLGRDRSVADIPTDHPSCSKQHAVLQFRRVQDKRGNSIIKLYIIDLNSANGTRVNGEQIPPSRYYELLPGDVIQFGASSRDYVLMSEDSV